MYHYRKTHSTYARHNAGDKKLTTCTFCAGLGKRNTIVDDGKTMCIIPNRVSYDIFEGRKVTDHLMVIPKRHLESFGEYTDEEKLEMLTMTAKYEEDGYNVYARGWGNISRSVEHQHTHLIKTDDRCTKAIFFVCKPYFLIKL